MTPAHTVALRTYACSWCGARPVASLDYDTGVAYCWRCLDHGPPRMTAAPDTTFAIDIGPAIASADGYKAGAEQGLVAFRSTFARIDDDETEARVADLVDEWAKAKHVLENQQTTWLALVKPIEKKIRGTFTPAIKACDAAIAYGKSLLQDRLHRKRAAVQAQLVAAAASQSTAEVQAAMAISVQAPPGMRLVPVWSAQVIDPRLVPAEFWVIDQAKLDKLASETKGQAVAPPGVQWVCVERMDRTGR